MTVRHDCVLPGARGTPSSSSIEVDADLLAAALSGAIVGVVFWVEAPYRYICCRH